MGGGSGKVVRSWVDSGEGWVGCVGLGSSVRIGTGEVWVWEGDEELGGRCGSGKVVRSWVGGGEDGDCGRKWREVWWGEGVGSRWTGVEREW